MIREINKGKGLHFILNMSQSEMQEMVREFLKSLSRFGKGAKSLMSKTFGSFSSNFRLVIVKLNNCVRLLPNYVANCPRIMYNINRLPVQRGQIILYWKG